MTYYRTLLPALVRSGCAVKVIEGSAGSTSSNASSTVIDGVQVETLEARRVRQWETRFTKLTATPSIKRAVAASWAMWEQADFGKDTDCVEATDFGLLPLAPVISSSVPIVMQMHGSLGQLAIHDPFPSQSLDGVLALAVESELAGLATEVQSYSQANATYWSFQAKRHVNCRYPAWQSPIPTSPSCDQTGRIAVFGRVQRWKGPQVLCEALRRMGPGSPLVDWYGRDMAFESGEMCSQWLLANYPDIWAKKVFWHGTVPPALVAQIQARSLLNVIPSTWDVFNFTAVEAMASQRPVICSATAGASDLIEDGKTGFVYRDNDPGQLAAALERALALKEPQQAALGKAAHDYVVRQLDPDLVASERVAAYKAAIATSESQTRTGSVDWLQRLCLPDANEQAHEYRCLDQFPLSALAGYTARRTLKKIRS